MLLPIALLLCSPLFAWASKIDRHSIVSRYNPTRNASSSITPMQVGNGNFAFGADVTGLQTFQPFAIMSSWGWKNDTLPANRTKQDILDYRGTSWYNHGKLVEYPFGSQEPDMETWLTQNPNRINLGRIGLLFIGGDGQIQNVTEVDLDRINQKLDLWTGQLLSTFRWANETIKVHTSSADASSTVSIIVESTLLKSGRLGIFLDFPWNDGKTKFEAPFVGNWSSVTFSNHTTTLSTHPGKILQATIEHTQVAARFFTNIAGDAFNATRDTLSAHRYTIIPRSKSTTFRVAVAYSEEQGAFVPSASSVAASSSRAWTKYWAESGFVDLLTGSSDPRAVELQRRIILSRYLMRVNEAGDAPPQESGLVNNGWYGKFHMEMFFWHSAHWALWNNWDILDRASSIYSRFLRTSILRAQEEQGWASGARWSKMTDPSGRSAPGEINNLLIWQQPHPLIFAEYEWRAFPHRGTLEKWKDVVTNTADWMADFAWMNASTGTYDLGPPMYVVSEDTSPNITVNPSFELSYWWLGLGVAQSWMNRLGESAPRAWKQVQTNLSPLPLDSDGRYMVYEGIPEEFWSMEEFTNDHPSLTGLHGWLPPTPKLNVTAAKLTMEKVWISWNISNCWGWDFPMLAMSAARNGDTENAIEWLLHDLFQFDDVGMPIGGVRVPTPYFPGSGSLLYAIAMMSAGWDGSNGTAPGFPTQGWRVRVEGMSKSL